jgi:hypothetical protein
MGFMHQTSGKQIWLLIATSTILLCGTLIKRNHHAENEPSSEIKKMDALLLKDLQHQEIDFSEQTKETMQCGEINENELRSYFDLDKVNNAKCDPGNCHYNSYTIESKTKSGKEISFVLTSGEDGNQINDLKLEGCN